MRKHGKSGFTLLELSIVLVIIALLTGGVFVGRSLIRSAQMNAVISEAARYTQAISDFRDKYQEYPGDFSGATNYWGALNANPALCPTTAFAGGTATCNGDGGGTIYKIGGGNYSEYQMVWQHLNNAGLISNKFPVGTTLNDSCGTYMPVSQLSGGHWYLTHSTSTGTSLESNVGNATLYGGSVANQHVLSIGTVYWNGTCDYPMMPVMTPREAFGIDTKIDDGVPSTGNVQAQISSSTYTPNCTTTDVISTAQYNTTNQNTLCNLLFFQSF